MFRRTVIQVQIDDYRNVQQKTERFSVPPYGHRKVTKTSKDKKYYIENMIYGQLNLKRKITYTPVENVLGQQK